MFSLTSQLEQVHGKELTSFLRKIGLVAEKLELEAYLVGGLVRDCLLDVRSGDIDIMVCGKSLGAAFEMATYLKSNWADYFSGYPQPRKVISFKRYGTCKLQFSQELFLGQMEVDFASSRREIYPKPGGVPEVSLGTLETDIARRDFSVNAIALVLAQTKFGYCFDPFLGIKDCQNKLIRVLHDKSFIDDPARLIRALRFRARFGFEFEDRTSDLFSDAMSKKLLTRLPPARLFDELNKAFTETLYEEVMSYLRNTNVVEQVKSVLSEELPDKDAKNLQDSLKKLEESSVS